jgi:hypothetical protein
MIGEERARLFLWTARSLPPRKNSSAKRGSDDDQGSSHHWSMFIERPGRKLANQAREMNTRVMNDM